MIFDKGVKAIQQQKNVINNCTETNETFISEKM